MSTQIRVINCVGTKLVGTARSSMVVGHDPQRGTSFGYNALYVRNISISGNGSALPAVLFVKFDLELAQCYTVSSFSGDEREKDHGTRIPYYTTNSADSRRLIAQCNPGEKHNIENKKITVQSIDVTTGRYVDFTDWTMFVVELELDA